MFWTFSSYFSVLGLSEMANRLLLYFLDLFVVEFHWHLSWYTYDDFDQMFQIHRNLLLSNPGLHLYFLIRRRDSFLVSTLCNSYNN